VAAMSEYQRLIGYLAGSRADRMTLTLDRLESEILGQPLPWAARVNTGWWANSTRPRHPQAWAWLEAGWRVEAADLTAGTVTFARS
jgi:hypothetical protein